MSAIYLYTVPLMCVSIKQAIILHSINFSDISIFSTYSDVLLCTIVQIFHQQVSSSPSTMKPGPPY